MNYNKKVLIVLFMVLSVFLISCDNIEKQDYGIITGFYIKDETIYWDDIENAVLYEVDYYANLDSISDYFIDTEYCFESHTVDYTPFLYENSYIIMTVYYEDETTATSDQIYYDYTNSEFDPIEYIGMGEFASNDILLDTLGRREDDFVNLTVSVGGIEFDVDDFRVDLTEHFTETELSNTVYEMTVIANYEDGSSRESHTYYAFSPFFNQPINYEVDYDSTLGEDLSFEFTEGEVLMCSINNNILGLDGIEAPDGIFDFDGNTITVSKNYLLCDALRWYYAFSIYTENHVYFVSVNM